MTEPSRFLFARRPALVAVAFYILGIFISLLTHLQYFIPLALSLVIFASLLYLYFKGSDWASWALAALLITCGWLNTSLADIPFGPNHVGNLADLDSRVKVAGAVAEEPDLRPDRLYLTIAVDSILINDHWVASFGNLRASLKNCLPQYDHSDYLLLSGYIYKPSEARNPGGFDYRKYLHYKNIDAALSVQGDANITIINKGRSFLRAVVSPLRDYLITNTHKYLAPLPAAILSGFILGERADIPGDIQQLFRDTGTMHLMAVSGSNVGLILAIFALPLTLLRLPRAPKALLLMVVTVFFALLTRLEPSVVRASIMALIGLLAYGWMRKPDYINLLGFAALIMLLWRPLQLFDVGMQLSFAATFGIIYGLPLALERLSFLNRPHLNWLRWLLILIFSTLAAQLAVLPLMTHYFHNMPLAGLAANVPIGLLAALAAIMGVIFYFSFPLGTLVAPWIAWPLERILSLVTYSLKLFSSLPYSNISVATPGWPAMVLYWLILYLAAEGILRRRFSRSALVAALIVMNLMIWPGLFHKRAAWQIEFLDIGRSHAWIFAGRNLPTMACLDCYSDDEDIEDIFNERILSAYDGKIAWLFSQTPDANPVKKISLRYFGTENFPEKLGNGVQSSNINRWTAYPYKSGSISMPAVKIIWPKSDNIDEGTNWAPALEVDIGDGAILLAAWTGVGILREYQSSGRVRLLELPWSVYARSGCLMAIRTFNPEVVVFSPDRYSAYMPKERGRLTHSDERLYATSLCGGFLICGHDSLLAIGTMKDFKAE